MKLATQQINALTRKGFHLAQPSTVLALHLLGLGEDTYFEDDRGVFVLSVFVPGSDDKSAGAEKGVTYVALHPNP